MSKTSFLLLASLSCFSQAQADEKLSPKVANFVEQFCLECHDNDTEKGDRSFEAFLDEPNSPKQHLALEEILDQLNLGEMPPQKKGVEQPPREVTKHIIQHITQYLSRVASSEKPQTTLLRRLTRSEYKNTIRDLLGVHPEEFDATGLFQSEDHLHGFKKNAEVQAMSTYQLNEYLNAAETYLEQALVFGKEKPKSQTYTFLPEDFNHREKIDISVSFRRIDKDKQYLDIGHGATVEPHPTYPKHFTKKGVPEDGFYNISIEATAVGRKHPYDASIFSSRADLDRPMELGLWHVPTPKMLTKRASEGRVFIKPYPLPDNTPKTFEAQAWMPKGSTPFVHWINGVGASKPILNKVQKAYHPETSVLNATEADMLRKEGIEVTEEMLKEPTTFLSDVYAGPRVRLFKLKIEGPIHTNWPPKSHRELVGENTNPNNIDFDHILPSFASKAFRTRVQKEEVQHYIDFAHQLLQENYSKKQALIKTMAAILTSPRFLYHDEGNAQKEATLSSRELANRMAYMLWNTQPDKHALSLLQQENDEALKEKEIQRHLDNPKFKSFVTHFSDSWLRLDKLGQMPPGKTQYPQYYKDQLESAMKEETYLFIENLFQQNAPLKEFRSGRIP